MYLRQVLFLITAAAASLGTLSAADSANWPTRPVTVVVPFPAGGSPDLLARDVAQDLSVRFGQQFVIENRSGATGNIGTESVARAAPDGYTILFGTPAPLALNPMMFPSMPFDPQRDFVDISLIAKSPQIFVTNKDRPWRTLGELLTYARANPGKVTVAIPGIGTTAHIAFELLLHESGVNMTIVPYRGGALYAADLMGGHVDVASDLISNEMPQVTAGKVRALAVTSSKRSQQLPDIPTVAESGFPGFEATAWFVLAAPTGTPADVVHRLNSAVNTYLHTEKGKKDLFTLGLEAAGGTADEATGFVKSEIVKWKPVIEAAGIKM